jgi:hypothetical protein
MATSYFSRTPASAGNRKTYTISFWQKRSKISYNYDMMIGTAYSAGAGNSFQILFDNTDKLIIQAGDGSWQLISTQLFRDVSAWYHIVVAIDTTQATDSNRIKMYVNGSQVTSFSTATYMSQNLDTAWNNTIVQKVGDFSLNYLEGYMANVYNIDGTALTPSSFGETDATTGIWKPKAYTGSYGTNGFFLKFENSASLGTDSSGNGNNFTVNGTPTQTVDTPSNVFATWNSIGGTNLSSLSFGNLRASTASTADWKSVSSTLGASSGKWYAEVKFTAGTHILVGVTSARTSGSHGDFSNSPQAYTLYQNGNIYNNTTTISTGYATSFSTPTIIGIALDKTNNKIYWSLNGTFANSANPVTGTNGISIAVDTDEFWQFCISSYTTTGTGQYDANFGNGVFGTTAISSPYSDGAGLGKFQYQPPTGYYALCTKNINVYG